MNRRAAAGLLAAAAAAVLCCTATAASRSPSGHARPGSTAAWQETSPGFVVPNDTFLREEWWLFGFGQTVGGKVKTTPGVDIRAPEAWAITHGSPSVVVAVLDTGVDYNHPDLRSRIWTNPGEMGGGKQSNGKDDDHDGYVDDWRGWNFVENNNDPMDLEGHGTPVAGVIAASGGDGLGITGIAPGVRIMAIRAGASVKDAKVRAQSIDYAVSHGARIVVMSYATEPSGLFSGGPEEADAIRAHPNVLFVASSGNDGIPDLAPYSGVQPCNTPDAPNLICVGATDQHDAVPSFSNMGPSKVQIAAPGDNMILAQRPRRTVAAGTFTSLRGWSVANALGGNLKPTGTPATWRIAPDPAPAKSASLHVAATGRKVDTTSVLELGKPLDFDGKEGCLVHFSIAGTTTAVANLQVGLLPEDDYGKLGNLFGGNKLVLGTILDPHGGYTDVSFAVNNTGALAEHGPMHLLVAAKVPAPIGTSVQSLNLRIRSWYADCYTPHHTARDYVYANGTSLSAPLTAGVAALVLSKFPNLTAVQVKRAILSSAVKVPALAGRVSSDGRLDAYGALLAAGKLAGAPLPKPAPAAPATGSTTSTASTSIEQFLTNLHLPTVPCGVPGGRGKPAPACGGGGARANAEGAPAAGSGSSGGGVPWWAFAAALGALGAAAVATAKKLHGAADRTVSATQVAGAAMTATELELQRLIAWYHDEAPIGLRRLDDAAYQAWQDRGEVQKLTELADDTTKGFYEVLSKRVAAALEKGGIAVDAEKVESTLAGAEKVVGGAVEVGGKDVPVLAGVIDAYEYFSPPDEDQPPMRNALDKTAAGAGLVGVGLMATGAVLSATGVGAVVGAPMLAVGTILTVGSGAWTGGEAIGDGINWLGGQLNQQLGRMGARPR